MKSRIEEGQLKDFTSTGPRLQDIERLVRGVRGQGVEVVLVNMPVTADYIALHPHGLDDYATYVEELAGLAENERITFLDLGTSVASVDQFSDPAHLNAIGAAQFSATLAELLVGD